MAKRVKKRIAKLTRKWREAEREKDSAVEYARRRRTQTKTMGITVRKT